MEKTIAFPRAPAACSEFIVFVPPDARFRTDLAFARLEAMLVERFPEYGFRLCDKPLPGARAIDGCFAVPLMGMPGPEPDTITMLTAPADELVERLAAALRAFDPDQPARFLQ